MLKQGGKLVKPERLPNGLFRFKDNTGFDRVVLDCVTSLKHGADLLWIETEKPHVGQIAEMVNAIREQVPNAKLVYNNSPSFNWTLNFRQQVFDAWSEEGKDVSGYDRAKLMSADYDDSELAAAADEKLRASGWTQHAKRVSSTTLSRYRLITLQHCLLTTLQKVTSVKKVCLLMYAVFSVKKFAKV